MRKRALLVIGLVVAVVVVVLLVSGGGSSSGGYRIRAIFDNGAFMVSGEQVRVAGANVGTIESVGVTMPGETVAYENGKGVEKPGKAILVMNISDAGFQDFRQDASCQIRPQSLIGEKFVDCNPTLPRAPGSQPPPLLKKVPSGQPGAGEYLLPLGNNGTSVDPDLINDIQSLPYAQRFRLIFNELGAGFAGRGEDLEVLVKRANPVLRDVDRLFGILSAQRDELAKLASDSEEILGPLSRERSHVAGFLANSGAAAEASSEKGEALEASLRKFPTFLSQFRQTMTSLQGFSEAGTPVLEDLGTAAPSLTDATKTLTPFSEALTVALKNLGKEGESFGPTFAEADPVVKQARDLAIAGVKPTKELSSLFTSLANTGGWDGLTELIYNSTAVVNGFDQYGHFSRTKVTLSNCVEYSAESSGYSGGGCTPRFNGPNHASAATTSVAKLSRMIQDMLAEESGGTSSEEGAGVGQSKPAEGKVGLAESSAAEKSGGTAPLLDYLLGQ